MKSYFLQLNDPDLQLSCKSKHCTAIPILIHTACSCFCMTDVCFIYLGCVLLYSSILKHPAAFRRCVCRIHQQPSEMWNSMPHDPCKCLYMLMCIGRAVFYVRLASRNGYDVSSGNFRRHSAINSSWSTKRKIDGLICLEVEGGRTVTPPFSAAHWMWDKPKLCQL